MLLIMHSWMKTFNWNLFELKKLREGIRHAGLNEEVRDKLIAEYNNKHQLIDNKWWN